MDREKVIQVLRDHGVEVAEHNSIVVMRNERTLEAQALPDTVPRGMLNYLARKFGIPEDKFHVPNTQH